VRVSSTTGLGGVITSLVVSVEPADAERERPGPPPIEILPGADEAAPEETVNWEYSDA
jgi:hypothetical protein